MLPESSDTFPITTLYFPCLLKRNTSFPLDILPVKSHLYPATPALINGFSRSENPSLSLNPPESQTSSHLSFCYVLQHILSLFSYTTEDNYNHKLE